MITRCYSIYDRKALAYHLPYYAVSDAVAVRTLSDVVGDPQTIFGRHPNDYVLYYVGDFNDANGVLVPHSPAVHIIDAAALIKALQSEIPFPETATTARPGSPDFDGDGTLNRPNGR